MNTSESRNPRIASKLGEVDPQIVEITANDLKRQQDSLMLIPSENYASRAVMEIAEQHPRQ